MVISFHVVLTKAPLSTPVLRCIHSRWCMKPSHNVMEEACDQKGIEGLISVSTLALHEVLYREPFQSTKLLKRFDFSISTYSETISSDEKL